MMASSGIAPSDRAIAPSERKTGCREGATGTRPTHHIRDIPSIIVISEASIIVIALTRASEDPRAGLATVVLGCPT